VELTLLEQPTPHLEDLAALAAEVPICADESVRSPADALRVAAIDGLAAINVKLMKSGVIDALDVIAVARSAGIPCMIGGMIETPLSMAFSAALAAAEPAQFRYIDLDTPLFMPPDAVPGALTYDGPELTLSPGPPPLQEWFS
jgi:L-alanine-DL-glutamate epimerase-like enolase superfamily enzyme